MKRTSAEDFVKAWQASTSHKEVARKCGIKPSTAAHRAWALRKRGIKLKRFTPSRVRLDIPKLARLAGEA